MATSNFDSDVSNYTIEELMKISGIVTLNEKDIVLKTDAFIDKFKITKPNISDFFVEVKEFLLDTINKKPDNASKLQLRQPVSVSNLSNVSHDPIVQKDIGVRDSYPVSIKQDVLNPNLKNTITRFVNLDSRFRQYTGGIESISSEYTLDLSDMLRDVLSICLYSYQIPYCWYTINDTNNIFWLLTTNGKLYSIKISPGNYTAAELTFALNKNLSVYITPARRGSVDVSNITYEPTNGKMTFDLSGCELIHPHNSNSDTLSKIIFFDFDNQNNTDQKTYLNNTLGWMMGFRVAELTNLYTLIIQSTSIVDLNGPKYLILAVDDYNQNHVNNRLVSITQTPSDIKMPSYFSSDLPKYNVTRAVNDFSLSETNGFLVAGKFNTSQVKYANVYYNSNFTDVSGNKPPRALTQSQVYTINEINKNRARNTNYLMKAPTNSDVLALIPVKTSGTEIGQLLVDLTSPLQEHVRTYFGPVNIDRMCIRLLDDRGNVLNMNGADWCVTLLCECLYQY
jgi:hypothetical protein